MIRVSIWVAIGAAIAAFVAGFSFANYLNRSQMTGVQASSANMTPESSQPASQPATLTNEEIDEKLKEAEANASNFAFQKGLGLGLYRYGAVQEDKSVIEKAIPVLERAYGLNSDDFDVLVGLGNAHFDLGYFGKVNSSFEKARTYYAMALTKRPRDVEIRTDVALTYYLMSPPVYTSAVTEFEKALAVDPKHEKSLGFLIQSLDALGRDATKYRDTLRSINPQNPSLRSSANTSEASR